MIIMRRRTTIVGMMVVLAMLACQKTSYVCAQSSDSTGYSSSSVDKNEENEEVGWISDLVPYDGAPRHHPITFSLNGVGYILTGLRDVFDMFSFNETTRSWKSLSETLSGERPASREYAYGVSVGNATTGDEKGFFGLGIGTGFGIEQYTRTALQDWWMYDPVLNTFNQRASMPVGRYHPAMVAVETAERGWSVYVGLGGNLNGNLKDWYEYIVDEDTWVRQSDLPGPARHHPYYFDARVGDKHYAYVGFGHAARSDGYILRDFYRYDSDEQSWTRMRDFPGEGRVAGTQFTIFDPTKGVDRPFILSGDGNDHSYMETGELWEYLPESDEWRQHSPHPGRSRWAPGSFVIGCDVYFTSGRDRYNGLMFNDLMMRRLC